MSGRPFGTPRLHAPPSGKSLCQRGRLWRRDETDTAAVVLLNPQAGAELTDAVVFPADSTEGAGIKFFIDPAGPSIRGGEVTSTQWDAASRGADSVAFGFDTVASGEGSMAVGRGASATHAGSFVWSDSNTLSASTQADEVTFGAAGGFRVLGDGASVPAYTAGDIYLDAANTVVTGKLTVTGLIDPTGLQCVQQLASPVGSVAATGTYWVLDGPPTTPMFTDSAGIDFVLNSAAPGIGAFVNLAGAPYVYFDTNNTERMRIENDGKIGVGTSAPDRTFVVNNATFPQIIASTSTSSVYGVFGVSSGVATIGGQDNALSAWTKLHVSDNADCILCKDGGYVGIGTTSPAYPLDVAKPGVSTSGAAAGYFGGAWHSGNHTANVQIKASQAMLTSSVIWISDERVKTNISPLEGMSRVISALKPRSYNYIDTVSLGSQREYGFIAQEVKEVLPDTVHVMNAPDQYVPNIYKHAKFKEGTATFSEPHGITEREGVMCCHFEDKTVRNEIPFKVVDKFTITLTLELGEQEIFVYGTPIDDYHTLNYESLTTVALAGVQELIAENTDLKARVARLEAIVEGLPK
jgi:hypothetical protein